VFSRVTIGFGIALAAASGLAAAAGIATSTAVIPAILGALFVLAGWFDRRRGPQPTARQRSASLFTTILAAGLVFSSAHGFTLIVDVIGAGKPLTSTGVFLAGMIVAGIGFIVFGAWWDVAEARRISRARAAAPAPRRSNRSSRSSRSGR
jgi:hypothetical protein